MQEHYENELRTNAFVLPKAGTQHNNDHSKNITTKSNVIYT